MSEDNVVYADVKFKNPKRAEGQNDATASPSNDATCPEVKLPGPKRNQPAKDPHKSNGGSKVKSGGFDPVKVVLVVFCVLLAAAVIFLVVLTSHLQQKCEHLESEKSNLTGWKEWKANHSATPCPAWHFPTGCPPCPKDWEHHAGKCYYFFSDELNWTESRADCISRGGHLAVIKSAETQVFLNSKASVMLDGDVKFWIGLTDELQEGTWLWVDNSPLGERYWFTFNGKNEPDDWKGEGGWRRDGEDCARFGEKGHNLNCWFDAFCDTKQKRICETKAIS